MTTSLLTTRLGWTDMRLTRVGDPASLRSEVEEYWQAGTGPVAAATGRC
jgi:hypothetical protein